MSERREETIFDLVVVGAGAAGQVAAIAAAEAGQRVIVLEQMPQAGMKIIASGGGRANLTHNMPIDEFWQTFGRQGRFILPALTLLGPAELRAFFARLGIQTVVDDHSRVYPTSQRATDVQKALTRKLEQLDVRVNLNCLVSGLWMEDRQLIGVETSQGNIRGTRVLLACGGRSWAPLGGTGGGYSLARQAGHTLTEPLPALVPLIAEEPWLVELSGVSLDNARLWIALPKQSKMGITGDVLFTHRGVSGPAVIDLSGTVSQLLHKGAPVPLRIELLAGMDVAQWDQEIASWRNSAGKKQVVVLLRERIPASLARALCKQAQLTEHVTAAELSTAKRQALAKLLGALELTITDTEGFKTAFVTRGGVKLKEVDPETLQSKRLPGLYLAGELLDLDGPTGGFNLQWAFASGYLVGMSNISDSITT
jgi:predicted Rossmann fold flavoprotein